MGAMSLTFTGTVEVAEKDPDAHRALLRVRSKEAGGQGHANADVTFQLEDGGGSIHTKAQITGKAASMGEGVVIAVLDALINDFTGKVGQILIPMATVRMREIREGEVPFDGGTAIQDDLVGRHSAATAPTTTSASSAETCSRRECMRCR